MITQERMVQFEYLLLQILYFVKFELSVRDAGICAFFSTADQYKKKEPTIRDMVTRSCGANTDMFYDSINALFSGKNTLFKSKYYTYIPINWHKKMDEICNKFMTSGINPPAESSEQYVQLIKKFAKSSQDEKRMIIRALSEPQSKS
ncbi:hypothetical protein [uncultured Desulfovibrio sp.]|uniref:hypothetical protein n=1 Tax=uncultured Desulfovibrio sp. TaxID=167968 RepID=UPI00272C1460|nr:hypothetical protein [uncultured Desulfovibrio sp.]